jgi:hypothetical protein
MASRGLPNLALPLCSGRPVLAPATVLGDVAMTMLSELAGVEDTVEDTAVIERDGTLVEIGGLAGLNPAPDLVGQAVELPANADAALSDFEHAGVPVVDRVEAIARSGTELTKELGAGKIGVEGEASHEGAVDEELKWHGGAPDGNGEVWPVRAAR